jgi:hypothetical protein
MTPDFEQPPTVPTSLEAGLRPIRRARLRAGCLALIAFPVALCGMTILLPRFWFLGGVIGMLVVAVYLIYRVADLPCPRCGQPFFGPLGPQRNALFAFRRHCWYCRLSL